MKSLHNLSGISKIFKYQDFTESVQPKQSDTSGDNFYVDFREEAEKEQEAIDSKPKSEPEPESESEPAEPEKPVISEAEIALNEAQKEAEQILNEARAEAEEMIKNAEKQADEIQSAASEEGHNQGYKRGLIEGRQEGREQSIQEFREKYNEFLFGLEDACVSIESQKQEILDKHIIDLGELALTVAEKVVHVALDSCAEVVKRMIAFAAAPTIDKQWAKVMISSKDAELMKADGINLKQVLSTISDRIDVIIVDDAMQGTCLVEFSDQVIDASATTQLRNIKALVRNAEKE